MIKDIYFQSKENGCLFGNSKIELELSSVNGKVFFKNLKNKKTGYTFTNGEDNLPIVYIPGFDYDKACVTFETSTATCEDGSDKGELSVTFKTEDACILYTLSLYENLPVVSAKVRLSGHFDCHVKTTKELIPDGVLGGKTVIMKEWIPENASVIGVPFYENHLNLTQVELFDATDDHNLVKTEKTFELFSPWAKNYQGNIFIVDNFVENEALMLVKEAPCKIAQTGNCDFDFFFNKHRTVAITGIGLSFEEPFDIDESVCLYGACVVVGDKNSVRKDYHDYYLRGVSAVQRYPQILSNTWGDGHADSCINEEFMLKELETAEYLGVDVIQLDDGWQKGHTAGSKVKKGGAQIGEGMYDQQKDFWSVRETFPNGLTPVLEKAKKIGAEIGLWYSCDATADYKYLKTDIKNVIELYNEHGVSTFKIDGIRIKNKLCEDNVYKILSEIRAGTDNKIKINMDITAGKRYGYFYNREFGNLFLENRFAKARTYYPYRTLRNLWDLSKYVPSQRFQIEVVNVGSYPESYKGDKLAPITYGQDYAFAVAMVANPLMWMEMQNLSDENKAKLKGIISAYKKERKELSECFIEPIGNRPSGIGFTGFNATGKDKGYLILFKEKTSEKSFEYEINLKGKRLTVLYSSDKSLKLKKSCNKAVLTGGSENSFIFVKYE
ncbi:MAG: alpha-galactosidase [Clostridia bacterium]|nr:alpha-galactosidase [Clostridia bacterium]